MEARHKVVVAARMVKIHEHEKSFTKRLVQEAQRRTGGAVKVLLVDRAFKANSTSPLRPFIFLSSTHASFLAFLPIRMPHQSSLLILIFYHCSFHLNDLIADRDSHYGCDSQEGARYRPGDEGSDVALGNSQCLIERILQHRPKN